MKRGVAILLLGVALAVAGYCAIYFSGTSRQRAMLTSHEPELAWLKREFHLSDVEFQRITELHEAYMPQCAAMCLRIDEKNRELAALLDKTHLVTPDISRKLDEAAQIRADCQKQMLAHFIEVSKAMPPEQGRRYLAWIESKTVLQGSGMVHSSSSMDHE